ncbi:MAG: hypothetical protein ACOYOK_01685 [Pseudobdellovibrionaceae bacterium]
MKKYNRAQEKGNSLTSVNKYTTFDFDEEERKVSEIQLDRKAERRTSGCDRKDNGKGKNKSGRSRSQDRCFKEQHQQDRASEVSSKHRFFGKDGRKRWSRGRTEDQKAKEIAERFYDYFSRMSKL